MKNQSSRNTELIRRMTSEIESGGGQVSFALCPGDASDETLTVPHGIDCIFTVGGDGTMVRTAQSAVGSNIPILGVNTGHMGYLCDLDENTVLPVIPRLLNDECEIEDRMMLKGFIDGSDTEISALNDVVISAGSGLDMVKLTVNVNDKFLYSYDCDGIIISTPTGSTAYNLSAGGPIVDPKTSAILITPINPHTLNNRSVVLDCDDKVSVILDTRHSDVDENATVSFDGYRRFRLNRGGSVCISRSRYVTRLIRLSNVNFLERISVKMREIQ
jgi:NAD+ kinase